MDQLTCSSSFQEHSNHNNNNTESNDEEKGLEDNSVDASNGLSSCIVVYTSTMARCQRSDKLELTSVHDFIQEQFKDRSECFLNSANFDDYYILDEKEEEDAMERAVCNGIRAANNSSCTTIGSYQPYDCVDPLIWVREHARYQEHMKQSNKSTNWKPKTI